mgnify:CR=1 FL=1
MSDLKCGCEHCICGAEEDIDMNASELEKIEGVKTNLCEHGHQCNCGSCSCFECSHNDYVAKIEKFHKKNVFLKLIDNLKAAPRAMLFGSSGEGALFFYLLLDYKVLVVGILGFSIHFFLFGFTIFTPISHLSVSLKRKPFFAWRTIRIDVAKSKP